MNTISVSFDPPANDAGSTIVGYSYTLTSTETTKTATVTNTSSPITISDLTFGVTYTLTLSAINQFGVGTASPSLTFTPGTPAAPIISGVYNSGSSLDVFFAQDNDGGAATLNYEYNLNNTTTWTALSPPSTEEVISFASQLPANTRTTLRLRGVNSRGKGEPSRAITLFKGTALTSPELTNILPGNGSFKLTILPPMNTADIVTSYLYTIDDGSTRELSASLTPENGTELALTGLTNNTAYTVTCAAFYADGTTSPYSTPIYIFPGRAAAPGDVTAIAKNQKLVVSFTTPATDGGAPITNYGYSYFLGDMGLQQPLDPSQTTSPITIPGLDNGRSYNISIYAINANGNGISSDSFTGTPTAEVPTAPVLRTAGLGNESLFIDFEPPESDGGQPITAYKYSVNDNITKQNHLGTKSPLEIDNLTNGTIYNITLYAINSVGSSVASNVLQASPTPGQTPESPLIIDITPAAQDDPAVLPPLQVYFTPPVTDGGYPITSYQYKLNADSWVTRTPNGSLASPILIDGLNPATLYKVRIRALNSTGAGASSPLFLIKTDVVVPGTVKLSSVDVSEGWETITATFNVPTNGGSPILRYDYFWETLSIDPASQEEGSISASGFPTQIESEGTLELPIGTLPSIRYLYLSLKIRAVNVKGAGEWSVSLPWTDDPEGIPLQAPTDLVASNITSSSFVLSFTPSPYNEPVEYYLYSITGGYGYNMTPVLATNNSITISGLEHNKTYRVSLQPYIWLRKRMESAMLRVTTGQLSPRAPVIAAVRALDRTILIYVSGLSDNNGKILGLSYSVDGGPFILSGEFKGAYQSNVVILYNTTNNVPYSVVVRAINNAGPGEPSIPVVVMSGAPTAPVITFAVSIAESPSRSRIAVQLSPPSSTGGSAITYEFSLNGGEFKTRTLSGLPTTGSVSLVARARNEFTAGAPSNTVIVPLRGMAGSPQLLDSSISNADGRTHRILFRPATDIGGDGAFISGYGYNFNGTLSGTILISYVTQLPDGTASFQLTYPRLEAGITLRLSIFTITKYPNAGNSTFNGINSNEIIVFEPSPPTYPPPAELFSISIVDPSAEAPTVQVSFTQFAGYYEIYKSPNLYTRAILQGSGIPGSPQPPTFTARYGESVRVYATIEGQYDPTNTYNPYQLVRREFTKYLAGGTLKMPADWVRLIEQSYDTATTFITIKLEFMVPRDPVSGEKLVTNIFYGSSDLVLERRLSSYYSTITGLLANKSYNLRFTATNGAASESLDFYYRYDKIATPGASSYFEPYAVANSGKLSSIYTQPIGSETLYATPPLNGGVAKISDVVIIECFVDANAVEQHVRLVYKDRPYLSNDPIWTTGLGQNWIPSAYGTPETLPTVLYSQKEPFKITVATSSTGTWGLEQLRPTHLGGAYVYVRAKISQNLTLHTGATGCILTVVVSGLLDYPHKYYGLQVTSTDSNGTGAIGPTIPLITDNGGGGTGLATVKHVPKFTTRSGRYTDFWETFLTAAASFTNQPTNITDKFTVNWRGSLVEKLTDLPADIDSSQLTYDVNGMPDYTPSGTAYSLTTDAGTLWFATNTQAVGAGLTLRSPLLHYMVELYTPPVGQLLLWRFKDLVPVAVTSQGNYHAFAWRKVARFDAEAYALAWVQKNAETTVPALRSMLPWDGKLSLRDALPRNSRLTKGGFTPGDGQTGTIGDLLVSEAYSAGFIPESSFPNRATAHIYISEHLLAFYPNAAKTMILEFVSCDSLSSDGKTPTGNVSSIITVPVGGPEPSLSPAYAWVPGSSLSFWNFRYSGDSPPYRFYGV